MAVQKSKIYRQSDEYKQSVVKGQQQWRDSLYGPEQEHSKICECCSKEFKWLGRERTTAFKKARFCSISCAKSRADYWDNNATRYQTIAFKHHCKECVVCGFDKIVAVHHYDHSKENNDPVNLIPLCPNHHEMIHHSLYSKEVTVIVDAYIAEWKQKNKLGV